MKNLDKIFLLALVIIAAVLAYLVFKPFLVIMLLAAALVTIFYPVYSWLTKKLNNRTSLAAILTTLLIVLLVLLPLTLVFFYFTQQAVAGVNHLTGLIRKGYLDRYLSPDFWQGVQEKYFSNFPVSSFNVKSNLINAISKAGNFLLSRGTGYLASLGSAIIDVFILILCLFFFFRDGQRFLVRIMNLTPLKNKYDQLLFSKWKEVSYSSIVSTLAAALAQTVVCGIGYAIIGLPVILFSVLSGFFALIPLVGPVVVWLPTAIVLLFLGKIWQAIFIIIWGSVVVGLIDNVVRTYIIKGKSRVHPLLVFFSILGGLMAFGFIGIILGPVILSVFLTLLKIYEVEFSQQLEK